MICPIHLDCPGCQLWSSPYDQQIILKKNKLAQLMQLKVDDIQFIYAGEHSLRTRFDFIVKKNEFGLVNKNKQLIPIARCLQLNSQLQDAFDLLKRVNFNVEIGTLRLRSSEYEKKYGLWLDFSNIDIKNLLLEKKTLNHLNQYFFIEIGQRKKTISFEEIDSQYKLMDPEPKLWFSTLENTKQNELKSTPLYCAVSNFTQPSPLTANLIVETILKWIKNIKAQHVWEFGSGVGQYTVPLLSTDVNLTAFEFDLFATQCLKQSIKDKPYFDKIQIQTGNFQIEKNITFIENLKPPQVCLVNPPKSGLKDFKNILYNLKPEFLIYVSCYPETMMQDLKTINCNQDYKIKETVIVDQFPQTDHFEVVCLLQRV